MSIVKETLPYQWGAVLKYECNIYFYHMANKRGIYLLQAKKLPGRSPGAEPAGASPAETGTVFTKLFTNR